NLNARIAPISNVNVALRIDSDAMRQVKFTRTLAFVSPIKQESAIRRKFCHAIVAVAVTHVDCAVGGERDIRRLIKMSSVGAGNTFGSDGQKKFSIVRKLKHLLKRAVGGPDVIVRVHTKAVRFEKAIFSPGRHQFPGIAIEAENCRDSDGMSLIGSPGIFRAMKD